MASILSIFLEEFIYALIVSKKLFMVIYLMVDRLRFRLTYYTNYSKEI